MNGFDFVVGYEDIKRELVRTCDVLRYPKKYEKLGVNMPHGILLCGDHGLGKTLMAECFIMECDLPVFEMTIPYLHISLSTFPVISLSYFLVLGFTTSDKKPIVRRSGWIGTSALLMYKSGFFLNNRSASIIRSVKTSSIDFPI